jgi:GNAT superfamily N-acetyltransferase
MTAAPAVIFARYDAASAPAVMDTVVVPVYEASHADVISDPLYSAARFAERVRGYMKAPGFEMAVVTAGGEPCGLALGYPLPAGTRWWAGLATPADPALTSETGQRTFALCELMVVPAWQGRGVAHALHGYLLGRRHEERAALLVREDNRSAQQAYARWGWRKAGKLRPYPGAPHYDALILPLGDAGAP